jgi:hypothetical protein
VDQLGRGAHRRIEAIADIEAWRADEIARRTPQHPLIANDVGAGTGARLGRAKFEIPRPRRQLLCHDYERDLREEDPDKAIDLIAEILKIETNPCCCRCSPPVPSKTSSPWRPSTASARADKRFHDLPGGVWYYRAPDELKARLTP